jgi:two-component system sensor histidine kinase UhpB
MRLFWRVFLLNAALLVAAGVVLALSPLTISAPIKVIEEVVLGVGVLLLITVNYAVLRPTFKPLERLAERMKSVDLLRPGRRLTPTGAAEVVDLVQSFNEMLERLEAERRESGRRALAAQEAERKRIAAELHDEVGQSMTGVLLLLEQVAGEVPAGRREVFAEAQEATRKSVEEVRRIAQELRPELLEHLGLVSALKSLATRFTEQAGLQLEWDFARRLPPLASDVELAIYRVAQESLTNVARHAGASRVWMSLHPGHGSVVLRVVDDGSGLNGQPSGDGGGLRGMRERAVMIRAALAIKPARTGGVEVRLEVPVDGKGP